MVGFFFNMIFSIIMTLLMLTLGVGLYILICLGRMRMFQKAGEAGWKAFIPFYRDYLLCKLTMGVGWYFILGYIPVFGVAMKLVYAVEVCRAYRQSAPMALLYFLLGFVAELVIGFGNASYHGADDLKQIVFDMFSYNKDDVVSSESVVDAVYEAPYQTADQGSAQSDTQGSASSSDQAPVQTAGKNEQGSAQADAQNSAQSADQGSAQNADKNDQKPEDPDSNNT